MTAHQTRRRAPRTPPRVLCCALSHILTALTWAAPLLALAPLASACVRPAEERAATDDTIGHSDQHGLSITVEGGLATIQAHAPAEVTLWAQAPALRIQLKRQLTGPENARFTLRNVLPDAAPTLADGLGQPLPITDLQRPRPTVITFSVALPPLAPLTLALAPPDADDLSPWRFAVLSDIQGGITTVGDIYDRMNEDPQIRFVLSTGDLVGEGTTAQLTNFQDRLQALNVPFYSTMGNHEIIRHDPDAWPRLFGRANVHFAFRGVYFSLVDSANAALDPLIYTWLSVWLAAARDAPHVFVTHYSLFDPVGPRNASFRSRREAAKLAKMLAEGQVDVAFFGHIHSFYQFSTAQIPSYISGGGGAIQERLDGIERHYLIVDVEPARDRVSSVGIVRVD